MNRFKMLDLGIGLDLRWRVYDIREGQTVLKYASRDKARMTANFLNKMEEAADKK